MKIKKFLIIFTVIYSLTFPVIAAAFHKTPDLYWLTYVQNGKGVYLMEIDSTGRVIKAPVFMPAGPAISRNGADKLNLWTDHQRAVIDKKTFRTEKLVKTKMFSPDIVTDKTQKNFAVISGPEQLTLQFAGVSTTGNTNGASWKIAYSGSGCDFVGCPHGIVASDGRSVLWIVRSLLGPEGIFIQPLLENGRPDGFQKKIIDDYANFGSISNVLPGEKIFLVLNQSDNLILQAINVQSGEKIGSQIFLRKAVAGIEPVSIDPSGHFIVYAHQTQDGAHFISFLPLDETGHPSGRSKVLIRKVDAYDIHLLKD